MEEEVVSQLDIILRAMAIRGTSRKTLSIKAEARFVGIGVCFDPTDRSSNERVEETSIVVDGHAEPYLEFDEVGGLASEKAIRESLAGSDPFSCIAISAGRLLVARDILGQKPLYFGKNKSGNLAFASLKTGLASIQAEGTEPLPPGKIISVSGSEISVSTDKSLTVPMSSEVPETEAASKLKTMLVEALSDEMPPNVALAFSGGLDSSLVAKAAMENDLRPELITVGMKGQPETNHAKAIAQTLGLDCTVVDLSQSQILESISIVAQVVETTDPVVVGVSIPLFFAFETAQEMGMKGLLAGQLSDELFGGYGRFDELARDKDSKAVENEIWISVLNAPANDFEPGDKLAVSHKMELRCPFAFFPLVQYALSLSASLKVKVENGKVVRKYILRRVAESWDLPASVVNRPKKAVQYSTGVQKVLIQQAKKNHLSLTEFVKSQVND